MIKVCDTTVPDALAQSHLQVRSLNAGAVAYTTAMTKSNKYKDLNNNMFIPVTIEISK